MASKQTQSLVYFENLDIDSLVFSDVKKRKGGGVGNFVYINLPDRRPVLVQTAKMYCRLTKWDKDVNKAPLPEDKIKYELNLSFYGEDGKDKNSSRIRKQHAFVKSFDDYLVKKGDKSSKEWYPAKGGKPISSLYQPILKTAIDKKTGEKLDFPDSIKVKMVRAREPSGKMTGRFSSAIRFVDHNDAPLDIDESNIEDYIVSGCQAICVLQLHELYLTTSMWGVSWKLMKIKIFNNKINISNMALLTEDDDDDETNEQAPVAPTDFIKDDDEDDLPVDDNRKRKLEESSSSSEDELDVPKPPEPKKRGVVKKK
jgi:hypothetical protein